MRKFTGDTLLVATHNAGKLEEFANLLAPFGISATGAAEQGLSAPEETGKTFTGNARIKAQAAATATGLAALADDSGIEIDGLDGAPGIYAADWAETPNGRDFTMAMTRVRDMLVQRQAKEPWTARFRCTLALAWPDGHDEAFPGSVEGRIVWPMRGNRGHGYDPIFQPDGHDATFGEMDPRKKNGISHRADAFARLARGCFG